MKKMMKRMFALLSVFALLSLLGAAPALAAGSTTKGYTIANSNTKVYKDTGLSTSYGTIFPTDEVEILSVTSKYVKAKYPTSSGSKTGYIARSAVLLNTSGKDYTANRKITTYRRASTSNTYGEIYSKDKVTVLGTKGSYTQVKYPVSWGYKYAFIKTSDAEAALYGKNGNAESQVQNRLNLIGTGSLTYNSKTVMAIGKKFVGYRAEEQCKGYAKNVFYLCFGVTPSSTQSKPNNHLLNSTSGMGKVGSVTSMTQNNISALFSKARPGDFVQMRRSHGGSHSAIVYSVSSSGVTFMEANTDGNNGIKKQTYSWSTLCSKNEKMSVYTATNYKLK